MALSDLVAGWLTSRADKYEYRYYLAQRDGDRDEQSRIKIEFLNEVKRMILAEEPPPDRSEPPDLFFSAEGRARMRKDRSGITPFDVSALLDDCDKMDRYIRSLRSGHGEAAGLWRAIQIAESFSAITGLGPDGAPRPDLDVATQRWAECNLQARSQIVLYLRAVLNNLPSSTDGGEDQQ